MNRTANFHYEREAHFVSRSNSLFFCANFSIAFACHACCIEETIDFFKTEVTIFCIIYNAADSLHINFWHFEVFWFWSRSVEHFCKSITKYTLFAEIDTTTVVDEVCNFVFHVDDRWKDRVDRFFASFHLFIKHAVWFPVREKTWATEDYSHSIDIVKVVFASVDDVSELFCCTSSEEVDRVSN